MASFGALPILFSGTQTPWDFAGNIINKALARLKQPQATDPFSSPDVNIQQMCALLEQVGKELVDESLWNQLKEDYTFTTVQGQALYPLPTDFGRMLNQTGWNRTNRLPLGGPLSDQEWQFLKAQMVGVAFTVLFRPYQQQIQLFPDTNTPGGYVIAFTYMSRFWVQQSGFSFANAETPTASTDAIWFDPELVVRGLKLAWLRENKLDSTAAQQDYTRRLQQAMGNDAYAPILSLSRRGGSVPFIGQQNVPLTGFGGS